MARSASLACLAALVASSGCALQVSMIAPVDDPSNHFNAGPWAVDFDFDDELVRVVVTNNTEQQMQVHWETAVYVGSSGRRQPVFISYSIDRRHDKHQRRREPYTLGRLEQRLFYVLPEENVPEDRDGQGGWIIPYCDGDVVRGSEVGLDLAVGEGARVPFRFAVD